MYKGSQNKNPGRLDFGGRDYATASFYRVKVTGGESEIIVPGTGKPRRDSDDKIIY